MKQLFDIVSNDCSKNVTEKYSTSFSLATRMLDQSIRSDIYNIYGFVRFADEIVDTFHQYPKKELFDRFEENLNHSLKNKISLNPILNSFQMTVNKYNIDLDLIKAFMRSMRWDLYKKKYLNKKDYKTYIYGSADVVGLMCLKVFVKGDDKKYNDLRENAMSLGSAFQKVNFLRDLKNDHNILKRSYFPNVDLNSFDENSKEKIIKEIENDFKKGLVGIFKLPSEAKFAVYTAYKYYFKLLIKLKNTPSTRIKSSIIRVPNFEKFTVLAKSYVNYRLNLL
ncbi:MAG: squalene/phytoene synthase family protein [Bacteroidota bacterium]|nr:squalene/phytoene synthase family protein [Bacteroidota bacterium]